MSSLSPTAQDLQPSARRTRVALIFRSHWTFAALQVLDLLTTLAAFRAGAFEINPLVAQLTVYFGRFGGVLASKMIAVLIAVGVRRLIWVVNIFYAGVVFWNLVILLLLSIKPH
jgi:hypothetical protein